MSPEQLKQIKQATEESTRALQANMKNLNLMFGGAIENVGKTDPKRATLLQKMQHKQNKIFQAAKNGDLKKMNKQLNNLQNEFKSIAKDLQKPV